MELAAQFTALAQSGLTLMEYTLQFCCLDVHSHYDEESLYWIGTNYYQ